MASSKNKQFEKAAENYDAIASEYTGVKGYERGVRAAQDQGIGMATDQLGRGREQGALTAQAANEKGLNQGLSNNAAAYRAGETNSKGQNALVNSEAQKYAGQQAANAAAGAQSQATTAARAAGMNKAQAAMMGSQQNANAFQNAYGNAYGQQLGNAANNQNVQLSAYNSAFENNANRMNSNLNNQQALANSNQLNQQQLMAGLQGAQVTGYGNQVSMLQGQDAQNFQQGGLFSDERLKHYKECSKKVVVRSPSKIKALKITTKGE